MSGIAAALVSGGLGLLGGIGSSLINSNSASSSNALNYKQQKEFAQNSIQWKVEDAKKAGLHPLAALGTQSTYYSPTSTYTEDNIGKSLSDMGQNIDRAVNSSLDRKQRQQMQDAEALLINAQVRQANAAADKAELEVANMKFGSNAILKKQPGTAPGVTSETIIPGQGDGYEYVRQNPIGNPGSANLPAPVASVTFHRNQDGSIGFSRSSDLADLQEDDPIGLGSWIIRNYLSALTQSDHAKPPKEWLPSGYVDWYFDPLAVAWYPKKTKSNFVKNLSDGLKAFDRGWR